MKYLLDTCVISELVKPMPSAHVVAWLEGRDEETLHLSVLTIGELQKGVGRLMNGRRKDSMQRWLDADLRHRFAERILPVNEDVAVTWGIVQAEAEQRGSSLPVIDGLITATALAHNLTIVTRNERDFVGTGARVLNPWELI